MSAQVKRCREPFAVTIDGMIRVISAGQVISTDDPAYTKATAQHFEDVDLYVAEQTSRRNQAAGIEEATAEPGEKRAVRGRGAKQTEPEPKVTDGEGPSPVNAGSSDKPPAKS